MLKKYKIVLISALCVGLFPFSAKAFFAETFKEATLQYQQISRQIVGEITKNSEKASPLGSEQSYQKNVMETGAIILGIKNQVETSQKGASFLLGDKKITFPTNLAIFNCGGDCFSGMKSIAQKVFSASGANSQEIKN